MTGVNYSIGGRGLKAGALPLHRRACCRNCIGLGVGAGAGKEALHCTRGHALMKKITGDYPENRACRGFARVMIVEGDEAARAARLAHLGAVDAVLGRKPTPRAVPQKKPVEKPVPVPVPRPDHRARILAAIKAGAGSQKEIMARVGLAQSTVGRYVSELRKDGMLPPVAGRRGRGEVHGAAVRELLDEGETSPVAIAREVGCSVQTVLRHRARHRARVRAGGT